MVEQETSFKSRKNKFCQTLSQKPTLTRGKGANLMERTILSISSCFKAREEEDRRTLKT